MTYHSTGLLSHEGLRGMRFRRIRLSLHPGNHFVLSSSVTCTLWKSWRFLTPPCHYHPQLPWSPAPPPGAGLIGQSRGRAGHPVHLTPDPSDTLGLSLKCRRPEQVCSYKAAQWEATSPLALAFGYGCQLNAVNRRQQKQDINLERGQEEVVVPFYNPRKNY